MSMTEKEEKTAPDEELSPVEPVAEVTVSPEEVPPVEEMGDGVDLRERVRELETLAGDLKVEAARAKADLFNYRQRMERDRVRMRQMALEDLVVRFLPVMDNLDRALAAGEDVSARDLHSGVSMVQRQFLQVLADIGVVPIETVGLPFDPARHEAVALCPADEGGEDCVVCEIQKGYCLEERVIRPAQVQVGRKS